MKVRYLIPLVLLSGCSWMHGRGLFHRQPVPPEPTQIVVSGAPVGSILQVDGTQVAPELAAAGKPQVVDTTAGMHTVEVHVNGHTTYREDLYVAPGEQHPVIVLSGNRGT